MNSCISGHQISCTIDLTDDAGGGSETSDIDCTPGTVPFVVPPFFGCTGTYTLNPTCTDTTTGQDLVLTNPELSNGTCPAA